MALDRRLLGILSLGDLKKRPREQWRGLRVREAMRPVSPSMYVKASASLDAANELIQRNGVGAVGVIEESGELVGFLRRGRMKKR